LLHIDFQALVEGFWRNNNVVGWMAYVLKEKFKGLKNHIREWSREQYGQADSKIAKLVFEINAMDVRSEGAGLSNGDLELRKNLFAQLWHLKTSKESVLMQRSRTRWLKEGDENASNLEVRRIILELSVSVMSGLRSRWRFFRQRLIILVIILLSTIGLDPSLMVSFSPVLSMKIIEVLFNLFGWRKLS
jgi:hypothetical protein